MNLLKTALDIFLHLDKNLALIVNQYGPFTYTFLFFIIFLETGFVITPFLPGDSLLFAAGTLAAASELNIIWLYILLAFAALAGDTVNYWMGQFVGPKIFQRRIPFLKHEYLTKTEHFYEKYGGKTIILARFIPIIRTFAPFVAGIGKMNYFRFLLYNAVGGLTWVALFLGTGFFFGNIPFVKKNFEFVILAIIIISLLPPVIEYLKHKSAQKTTPVIPGI